MKLSIITLLLLLLCAYGCKKAKNEHHSPEGEWIFNGRGDFMQRYRTTAWPAIADSFVDSVGIFENLDMKVNFYKSNNYQGSYDVANYIGGYVALYGYTYATLERPLRDTLDYYDKDTADNCDRYIFYVSGPHTGGGIDVTLKYYNNGDSINLTYAWLGYGNYFDYIELHGRRK